MENSEYKQHHPSEESENLGEERELLEEMSLATDEWERLVKESEKLISEGNEDEKQFAELEQALQRAHERQTNAINKWIAFIRAKIEKGK